MKKFFPLLLGMLHIVGVLACGDARTVNVVLLDSVSIDNTLVPRWRCLCGRYRESLDNIKYFDSDIRNLEPFIVKTKLNRCLPFLQVMSLVGRLQGVTAEQYAVLSAHTLMVRIADLEWWKQPFCAKTGIDEKVYEDTVREIMGYSRQIHALAIDMCPLHNFFARHVMQMAPIMLDGELNVIQKCRATDEQVISIADSCVGLAIIQWWNNVFMDIAHLSDNFIPEYLGMPHNISACLDGAYFARKTFASENIPLVITHQTNGDYVYVGQTVTLIGSIKRYTSGKKYIIVLGEKLSEELLRFFESLSSTDTIIVACNIDEKYFTKAESYKTEWSILCAVRIFYPQIINELYYNGRLASFGLTGPIRYFLHVDSDVYLIGGRNANLRERWDSLPCNFKCAAADWLSISFGHNVEATVASGISGVIGINYRAGQFEQQITYDSLPSGGIAVYNTDTDLEEVARIIQIDRIKRKAAFELIQPIIKSIPNFVIGAYPGSVPTLDAVMLYFSLYCQECTQLYDRIERARGDLHEVWNADVERERRKLIYEKIRKLCQPDLLSQVQGNIDAVFTAIATLRVSEQQYVQNLLFVKKFIFSIVEHMLDQREDEILQISPSEEEVMANLPGLFLYLSSSWNLQLGAFFPNLLKNEMLKGDRAIAQLQQSNPYARAGICKQWQNGMLMHLDGCYKIGPEFIQRCKYERNSLLVGLYWIEGIQWMNEQLKSAPVPKEWIRFVDSLSPYFSSTPSKVIEAFNEIDMTEHLNGILIRTRNRNRQAKELNVSSIVKCNT